MQSQYYDTYHTSLIYSANNTWKDMIRCWMQLIMSYFNHIANRDIKPDSPQMKKIENTKDPQELGSSRMGKRNHYQIVHQTQIRQSD